jgi:hypothetical protein
VAEINETLLTISRQHHDGNTLAGGNTFPMGLVQPWLDWSFSLGVSFGYWRLSGLDGSGAQGPNTSS